METMNKLNKSLVMATLALSALSVDARERVGSTFKTASPEKVMAGCTPAQSSAELAVNNVRTIVFASADMWWDLFGTQNAWYYVPKVEDRSLGASSNFAGSVWFGGLDAGNQLKLAAQTYRQNISGGVSFWPGPLTTGDATVSSDVCLKYDKIFKMTRAEVDNFVLAGGAITDNIKNWPGNGDITLNQDLNLAPFVDVNGDGYYRPETDGDYPYYDVYNQGLRDNLGICKARVFGDETLWWVYNDAGNTHGNGGKIIGMEIRAQAFAFKTTDEINNMTFYNYQLVNRSSFPLYNTYMTVWTDADMGYYADDYIGCDVQRGMGYVYNGDSYDEDVGSVRGYHSSVPALGCDFFQGPIPPPDGIDNDGDGTIDELGEQMGMTKFMYFNNAYNSPPPGTLDPDNAAQYYQYMTGYWKDGSPLTCGGNGYGGTIPTDYAYPADTYTNGPCGMWEETAAPADRRFLQSAGPFVLQPGAINYVTFGLPWARTTSTDPKASIPLLKVADDKAQALFDNCFRVLSGPEAPDMTIQELENELIIYFTNKPGSNNYLNQYKEEDVTIQVDPAHFPNVDRFYRFEGFKLYQLKNNSIIQEELDDPSKAKLIFNCDVANGITRIVNYEYDAIVGGDVPKVKVDKNDMSDKGVKSSFRFTEDAFSTTSDKKVINHKEYYFFCVAYGYNQYGEYKQDQVFTVAGVPSMEGQKKPYLEGRKSKKAIGVPHNPASEKDGTIANSTYGYGPKVTRLEGQGNGGNYLDLTAASVNDILASSTGRADIITYENGRGPINIKVVDPLNVPNSEFTLAFINRNWFYNSSLTMAQINDTINSDPCRRSNYHKTMPYPQLSLTKNVTRGYVNMDTTTWILKDLNTSKEYYPCKSIKIGEEYYFSELGLSINIGGGTDIAGVSFPANPNKDKVINQTDIIGANIFYSVEGQNWLSGVADVDGASAGAFNWIRSGNYVDATDGTLNDYKAVNDSANSSGTIFADEAQYFENVLGGTWAPYALVATAKQTNNFATPGYANMTSAAGVLQNVFDLRTLASVDIVLTKDKSKWTRCLVLEQNGEPASTSTHATKLEPRRRKSVDKQGIGLGEPGCNTAEAQLDTFTTGLGWFPGYAINLETGERLNIAFGEDSYQTTNNGDDMMWNPTNVTSTSTYPYAFGGRHYIYVFGNNRSGSTYNSPNAAAPFKDKLIGAGPYNMAAFTDMVHVYKWANNTINTTGATSSQKNSANVVLTNLWADAMWTSMPVTIDAKYNFKHPEDMSCDARVALRVKKAYRPGMASNTYINASAYTAGGYVNPSTALNINYAPTIQPYYGSGSATINGFLSVATTNTLSSPVNNNFGLYKFSTSDIYTEINNAEKMKSALDLINIVPNPYYAYSKYETNRIDNRVRITNLPNKCRIKIFTLNGTLVRTFNRDVSGQEDLETTESDYTRNRRLAYQDWDLKNQSGITVASGLYIIHVDVPGVGEKILKWFGVMRPLDLQSY